MSKNPSTVIITDGQNCFQNKHAICGQHTALIRHGLYLNMKLVSRLTIFSNFPHLNINDVRSLCTTS